MSAPADPRKDAVQSGVALVMRGLLQTMYAYCKGPPSTPQIEAELGKQLIGAGRVLQRYGRHVASGAVGSVRSESWATHRVRLFGQVERNRDSNVLNDVRYSG